METMNQEEPDDFDDATDSAIGRRRVLTRAVVSWRKAGSG